MRMFSWPLSWAWPCIPPRLPPPPYKSIYCLLFLALCHFPFFMISSLWSCVSFSSPRHGCRPSCSPRALRLPFANETRAASPPGFCHPAVSFLKYKLIFIQWSSWANLILFTEKLIITWSIKKFEKKGLSEELGSRHKESKQKFSLFIYLFNIPGWVNRTTTKKNFALMFWSLGNPRRQGGLEPGFSGSLPTTCLLASEKAQRTPQNWTVGD